MEFSKIMYIIFQNWKDIIIFITFVALLFQLRSSEKTIKLSTEVNELTKDSIKKSTQIRELELMPKKHFIIHSQFILDKYIKEINEAVKILNEIKKDNGNHLLIDEISNFYREQEGLLKWRENTPIWLIEIVESATQYYFVFVSNLNGFEKGDKVFNKRFSINMLNRANESLLCIKELECYVQDMIPKLILNCPAAIDEQSFYKNR